MKLRLTKFKEKNPRRKTCVVEEYTGTEQELLLDSFDGYQVKHLNTLSLAGSTALTYLELGTSVESVCSLAVSDCPALREVVLSDNLSYIGDFAFQNCTSISHIFLPEELFFLGQGAFAGCNALVYNDFGCMRYLGSRSNPFFALMEVTDRARESYEIHKDTRIIAPAAFAGCDKMESITIPEQIKSIGSLAFQHTTSLKHIYWNAVACKDLCASDAPFGKTGGAELCFHIGAQVERLPDTYNGFFSANDFGNLCRVSYAGTCALEQIGKDFFAATNLQIECVPPTVLPKKIRAYAYRNCPNLVEAHIQAETIEANAFYCCENLKKVCIGAGTCKIEAFAFLGCKKLTEVIFAEPSGWRSGGQMLKPEELTEALCGGRELTKK